MGDFSILGSRIKKLRASLNMTQKDFAAHVGCTAATLSAYENGSKSPSLEIVKSIAEKCKVSIDWLCGLSDKKNDDDTIKTYADLVKLLLKIQKIDLVEGCFEMKNVEVRNYITREYSYKSGLFTSNEKIRCIIQDINKMQAVLNDGTINQDIFNTWLDGFLEKYDKQLLTWESIKLDECETEN